MNESGRRDPLYAWVHTPWAHRYIVTYRGWGRTLGQVIWEHGRYVAVVFPLRPRTPQDRTQIRAGAFQPCVQAIEREVRMWPLW